MEKHYLLITPKNGLCNQLSSISRGIILGLISNRDIIFTSFQLDYKNTENICNFHSIIDLDYIQKKLEEKNIKIKIYSDIEIKGEKIIIDTNEDLANMKDLISYLLLYKNKKIKYLDIGCPISCNIPLEYEEIFKYINLNIKFTDKYIDIANSIKKKLGLKHYCCVHLRLEDDSINFMKELNKNLCFEYINNIYKQKYLEEFELLETTKQKIYVCTSLCMNDNINNDFYNYLKTTYNIVDKNDIIKIYENDCREIYGIIDFIIAQDSLYFSGSDWSSFSIYLYSLHKNLNKDAKLLNIWDILRNKEI
jgi:hypothetical protein